MAEETSCFVRTECVIYLFVSFIASTKSQAYIDAQLSNELIWTPGSPWLQETMSL